jgi:hypothetical protein
MGFFSYQVTRESTDQIFIIIRELQHNFELSSSLRDPYFGLGHPKFAIVDHAINGI